MEFSSFLFSLSLSRTHSLIPVMDIRLMIFSKKILSCIRVIKKDVINVIVYMSSSMKTIELHLIINDCRGKLGVFFFVII